MFRKGAFKIFEAAVTDKIEGNRYLDEMLSLDQGTPNRMSLELSTSSLEQF